MDDDRDFTDDPLDLPILGGHSPATALPGRVRSTWKFPTPDPVAAQAPVKAVATSRVAPCRR